MKVSELAGVLVASAVIWIAEVWFVMLVIGAAHSADDRIPALGWSAVAWLCVAANMVVGVAAARSTQSK